MEAYTSGDYIGVEDNGDLPEEFDHDMNDEIQEFAG